MATGRRFLVGAVVAWHRKRCHCTRKQVSSVFCFRLRFARSGLVVLTPHRYCSRPPLASCLPTVVLACLLACLLARLPACLHACTSTSVSPPSLPLPHSLPARISAEQPWHGNTVRGSVLKPVCLRRWVDCPPGAFSTRLSHVSVCCTLCAPHPSPPRLSSPQGPPTYVTSCCTECSSRAEPPNVVKYVTSQPLIGNGTGGVPYAEHESEYVATQDCEEGPRPRGHLGADLAALPFPDGRPFQDGAARSEPLLLHCPVCTPHVCSQRLSPWASGASRRTCGGWGWRAALGKDSMANPSMRPFVSSCVVVASCG